MSGVPRSWSETLTGGWWKGPGEALASLCGASHLWAWGQAPGAGPGGLWPRDQLSGGSLGMEWKRTRVGRTPTSSSAHHCIHLWKDLQEQWSCCACTFQVMHRGLFGCFWLRALESQGSGKSPHFNSVDRAYPRTSDLPLNCWLLFFISLTFVFKNLVQKAHD